MKTIKIQMEDIKRGSMTGHCRKLIDDGEPPDTHLEVYRGDMLCLYTPKGIGALSKYILTETDSKGFKYKKYTPPSFLEGCF